ncbi:MAG: hypothetical protein A3K19_17660 [Lentisphaerae bacterium RIFOXYB12_FULL_65_16]|nr:MAG: hypothetical protein A3K18_28815 [Lentisphaerae bacterium RIFOXYA12_64_32]OGV90111.1 MAG: hypothetical protein A3K19_17660 [Lentisphaerae bacterium RIFOXYB12_FULL_65_16]
MAGRGTPIRIAVIMAGGTGERFWPLSRQNRPKQLLKLADPNRSMLAEALSRISPPVSTDNVFVVTGKTLEPLIQRAGLRLAPQNVLTEPCKRNTTGCLIYAAAVALVRLKADPTDVVMGVLTADHSIPEEDRFRETVAAAFAAAENSDCLVTIGMKPTRPETGYGYIEIAENPVPQAGSDAGVPAFKVMQFREKPNLATAMEFLETNRFLWNSGMFFWRLSSFLKELQRANPEIAARVPQLVEAMEKRDTAAIENIFSELPDKSIDFVLMEHSRNVLVVPGEFRWNDVGAWDALDRTLPCDNRGNVTAGDPVLVDVQNCVVYNDAGAGAMAVACVGVHDLIVVVTRDGVVVLPKNRSQDIRLAVAELKKRGAPQV